VNLCRKSKGPVFIEFLTYRQRGHVGPDDNIQGSHTDIRPKQEIAEWKKKDPLKRFERFLIREHILSPAKIDTTKKEIENEVMRAHRFARESPYPVPEELNRYVYAN
jgi:TPP-dependent pyruvate/acetoin dehydrogenase alpha subunit